MNIEKEIKQLNVFEESNDSEKQPLTVEKIKTYEGFENVIDEEAMEAIYTIETLCRITQEYLMYINNNENTNPLNIAA
jgi:ASC-1-like (ASCH) protein